MKDILCIYYSRTGNTKRAMEEIAQALDAETVRVDDAVERVGWRGYLRCGMDAMRRETAPLLRFETDQPLERYKLVIIGTPVWAGRCSAVIRSFLKAYGGMLHHTAFVVTRSSDGRFQEIYRQMDNYLMEKHAAAVSLRCDSVGYHFWQEEFLRQVREYLGNAQ
jgi:menaquinone-dependent protoporphyrinogen IX oxidase